VLNSDFNRLRIGMTKQEVLQTVGEPNQTSTSFGEMVWHYEYVQPFDGSKSRRLSFGGDGRLRGWN